MGRPTTRVPPADGYPRRRRIQQLTGPEASRSNWPCWLPPSAWPSPYTTCPRAPPSGTRSSTGYSPYLHEVARQAANHLPGDHRAHRRHHNTQRPLRIETDLDGGCYPPQIEVTKPEIAGVPSTGHTWHLEWNYSIAPNHPKTLMHLGTGPHPPLESIQGVVCGRYQVYSSQRTRSAVWPTSEPRWIPWRSAVRSLVVRPRAIVRRCGPWTVRAPSSRRLSAN
jgi:hypothetical protein